MKRYEPKQHNEPPPRSDSQEVEIIRTKPRIIRCYIFNPDIQVFI